MPTDKLKIVEKLVKERIKEVSSYKEKSKNNSWSTQEIIDRSASLYMTLGSVQRELGDFEEAAKQFQWIFDHEKQIKNEKLVVPFSHFEQGILHFLQGKTKETRKSFKNVKNYSDYNFEYRLDFRMHIALLEMDKKEM